MFKNCNTVGQPYHLNGNPGLEIPASSNKTMKDLSSLRVRAVGYLVWWLNMVEPTRLKDMRKSNWIIFFRVRGENKQYSSALPETNSKSPWK